MDILKYPPETKTLTPSKESFDYIDLDECTCASCNHWKTHMQKRQTQLITTGILIPLVWIYNIIQIIFGLYFRNHNPRSICQYVKIYKRVEHLSSNVKLNDGYVNNHMKTRDEMLTGLGHTFLAIAIYVLIVFIAAIGSADFVRTGRNELQSYKGNALHDGSVFTIYIWEVKSWQEFLTSSKGFFPPNEKNESTIMDSFFF